MSRCLLRPVIAFTRQKILPTSIIASIHSSSARFFIFPPKVKEDEVNPGVKTQDVVKVKQFLEDELKDGDAKQFINTVENFQELRKLKRFGYAEFIGAALPAMKLFGVHKDLEAYKTLMKVFPPGSCLPATKLASGFYPHYIQQTAALGILAQMEEHKLMPDKEMEQYIISVFSKYSQPWEKCVRLIYWLTKFKNANPFPFPETIPQDPLELALVALKRMSLDPQSDLTVYSVLIFYFPYQFIYLFVDYTN